MLRQRGWVGGWLDITRWYCINTAKPILKLCSVAAVADFSKLSVPNLNILRVIWLDSNSFLSLMRFYHLDLLTLRQLAWQHIVYKCGCALRKESHRKSFIETVLGFSNPDRFAQTGVSNLKNAKPGTIGFM